jgi:hypothetical protein
MQKHHDSDQELTPLQIQDIAERAEVDTPIMSYKVVGNRVELHLLGGAIASVEAHWLLTEETAEQILEEAADRLKELLANLDSLDAAALYKVAQDINLRGRAALQGDKAGLIAAIQKKQKGKK